MNEVLVITQQLKDELTPVITSEELELVDLEYRREKRGWVLRVFLYKEDGVNVSDCENISRQIGQLIDVKELIVHPYTLEVSSPGLDRPLKKTGDFSRNLNKYISVTTYNPIKDKTIFKGSIKKVNTKNNSILLAMKDGDKVNIPIDLIKEAKLEITF